MFGYLGQILRVDLAAGQAWSEPLNPAYARAYVGGSGLAARYLYDLVGAETDPLAPENPLVFMTGPLVGAPMPLAGRHSVCALSPLTGLWGEASSGGFFGAELRFAGYDGLIITGQSPQPVWLSILAGQPALHPAADLWGLDTVETQARLQAALGLPKARVACIGPAGERLVKLAGVVNDHGRIAARTGLGAVMGRKQLKAIAVSGAAVPGAAAPAQVPLADPAALQAAVRAILKFLAADVSAQSLRLAGTGSYVALGHMYGDLPCRYYQQAEWEGAEALSGVNVATQFQTRNTGCYRCAIACGRQTRAPRYGVEKADGPEYETLGALGALNLVDDLEAVIYAGHLCNLAGVDTISAGATIALAIELFQRGLLTPAHTGGLALQYGDPALLVQLVELLCQRQGFGAWLAEGSASLAARCGVPQLAVVVNRLEVPLHDPRAFAGMAVTYALSPRGACHMQGNVYGVDNGSDAAEALGITPSDRFDTSVEKGRLAARHMAWRSLYNSLTLCQFENPGPELLLAALNAVTGWDLALPDLLALGRQILALKRTINLRRGLTPADDTLPALLLQPLAGGTEGHVPDLPTLLQGAYAELDWDPQTGAPRHFTP
jgi:aldehyde:ferredoxin oxidoreductase